MTEALNTFLTGFGTFLKGLGFGGCVVLLLGLIILSLVLKCATRAVALAVATVAGYRRLPLVLKQAVWLAGGYVALRVLWPIMPKTTTFVALGAAVASGFCYGGVRLSNRYGLGYVWPWEAWIHHWEMTAQQRGLTRAIENTTGKKNGRARKPTKTATGFSDYLEPPDGLSAEGFAELINNGEMAPAVAREQNWGEVKRMTATAMPDHTVLVHVDRLDAEAGELLADVEEWTP